jgi:hemolysin activation/secretion protein
LDFSFSDTEEDGRTKLGSIRGQIDWVNRSRNSAYSISNHLEWGTDIAGSPNFSDYALLGGSLGYKGALDDNTQFTLKGTYQWADTKLPSAKKMGLGGAVNLRGVANNTIFTDSALFLSAQIDRKVGTFLPWAASSVTDGQLYLNASSSILMPILIMAWVRTEVKMAKANT